MNKPKTHLLKDYQPADFMIDSLHLHVDLHEQDTNVKSVLKMKRNPKSSNQKTPLKLNGEAMTLKMVSLDGRKLDDSEFTVDDAYLTINNVPDEFTLETEVIIQPKDNTQLSGLFQSRGNFCTQCESEGFRRITYYLDRPDVMTRFTTTITADKTQYPVLLSNGNLIETRALDNNRHWVHWEDPTKKPSYLFALVAGDFDLLQDQFKTMSGRTIDLHLYLEKGYKDQGDFALQALKKAMRWDEQTFGREYDLDLYMIVAVSDFNMGAMENKGLNIFNTSCILAKPETATDADYVTIESVIGHEYFHNWSGNRVTLRDWFQLTQKEGLTVFRDQLFTEDMLQSAVSRIDVSQVIRDRQFAEDAGPLAHSIRPKSYIEINNFYTMTVYRKGAEVIGMVRTLLSPAVFRKGMDLYFSRYDGQAVTTEDFIAVMEEVSKKDLTQFKRWYDQAGTPELKIRGEYDATQKTYTLHVEQMTLPTPGQQHKEPVHLPLTMGLIGPKCNDMPLQLQGEEQAEARSLVLEITKPKQSFTFVNVASKPVPSLLRHFSAPVKLDYDYSNEELAWLWQCDSDSLCRWDAGQQLMTRVILESVSKHQSVNQIKSYELLTNTFASMLTKEKDDLNLLARLLALPAESYLLQQMQEVDIAAFVVAFQSIFKQLAISLETNLLKCYQTLNQKKPYQFDTEAMGQRSLKNLCLNYLLRTGKDDYYQLAYQQFKDCDNMTDCFGALRAFNDHDVALRKQALSEFYEQWQKEALVVNKWFMLQALSRIPGTLGVVQKLMQHQAFNIHNPNNVHALIIGFSNNVVGFHGDSGAGYRFIADQVLKIDPENAIVAARVLQPLTRWQRLGKVNGPLMHNELLRIKKQTGLSNDVYEIVEKSV